MVTHASGEGQTSFWYDMTEAGLAALMKVMRERRVAIQFVNPLLYITLEDLTFGDQNWQPIVLLPARAGNVDTPNWLMRAPDRYLKEMGWKTRLPPAGARFYPRTSGLFLRCKHWPRDGNVDALKWLMRGPDW